MSLIVKCPKCGRPSSLDTQNKFRPFCSQRCSLNDLGAWAEESYKVPTSVQETESVNQNDGDDPPSHQSMFDDEDPA